MPPVRVTSLPSPPGLSRNPSGNGNAAATAQVSAAAQRRGVALEDLQGRLAGPDSGTARRTIEARDAEIARLRTENRHLRAQSRYFASQESRLVAKLGQASQDLAVEREEVGRLRGLVEAAERAAREGKEEVGEWCRIAVRLHDRALVAEDRLEEVEGTVMELEEEVEGLRGVEREGERGVVGEERERWW